MAPQTDRTSRLISLPEWAHRRGLSWTSAYGRMLAGECEAERIGARWYVRVPADEAEGEGGKRVVAAVPAR